METVMCPTDASTLAAIAPALGMNVPSLHALVMLSYLALDLDDAYASGVGFLEVYVSDDIDMARVKIRAVSTRCFGGDVGVVFDTHSPLVLVLPRSRPIWAPVLWDFQTTRSRKNPNKRRVFFPGYTPDETCVTLTITRHARPRLLRMVCSPLYLPPCRRFPAQDTTRMLDD